MANKQGSSVCTRFAFNTSSIPPSTLPPPPPSPRHDFHRATDVHVSRHVNRTRGRWYIPTDIEPSSRYFCVSGTSFSSLVPRNVTYIRLFTGFLSFFLSFFINSSIGNVRILLSLALYFRLYFIFYFSFCREAIFTKSRTMGWNILYLKRWFKFNW